VSIVVTAVLGVVWVLFLNYEQLADQFVVAIFPFYALAAAAVFVLRRRQPDRPRPVRVWGYPVVPLLFVVATFVILGNALREHPGGTGLAFGAILLGVPVYWWWLRTVDDPLRFAQNEYFNVSWIWYTLLILPSNGFGAPVAGS